jgi:Protein of unknown function (DUF3140)
MAEDSQQIIRDFKQVVRETLPCKGRASSDFVNMSPQQLKSWLATDDSQQVGQKNGGDESIGHKSGERIVELLDRDDYSDDDLAHMRKVVSYVRRHSAQHPKGEIENTR